MRSPDVVPADSDARGRRSGSARRHGPALVAGTTATAVWLGVVSAVLLFSVLLVATGGLRPRPAVPASGPPAALLGPQVVVWVAELSPGVKAVLSSEWGQPVWDATQDEALSRALHLGERAVAIYSYLVFNTSGAPATVDLSPGSLVLVAPGGETLPSLDFEPLLASAGDAPAAATLRRLGAGRGEVSVPNDRVARLPVVFGRRVPLEEAMQARRGDGTVFHRRRMGTREWAGLLVSPSADALRDL